MKAQKALIILKNGDVKASTGTIATKENLRSIFWTEDSPKDILTSYHFNTLV